MGLGNFASGLLTSDRNPDSPQLAHALSAVCSIVSCVGFLHVVFHTHSIPDAVTLGGLGAFSTVHYAVNRLAKAVTP